MTLPLVFALLLIATASLSWRTMIRRTRGEWLADLAGLVMQGVVIPLLQTAVLAAILMAAAPQLRGAVPIGAVAAFLLQFVVVDYLYYWNHRLLHGSLWRWHAMHHTATSMDVLVTSRNTLWTPLLIVYVWVNALMIVVLERPDAYLAGMTLTAALDLWRHSPWHLPKSVNRIASLLFVTSREHAWHHSRASVDVNFGANFSLWDRLHGTYRPPDEMPESLGVSVPEAPLRNLLLPIGKEGAR